MLNRSLEYRCEFPDAGDAGVVVYTLAGGLCGHAPAYGFQDEVREKIAGGTSRIVIDLAGVQKIDSCGIGILASLMWSASQAGGGLVLAAVPKQVEKLLGIVMLLDHIDHADDRDAAIAMLARR